MSQYPLLPGNLGLRTAELTDVEFNTIVDFVNKYISASDYQLELLTNRGMILDKATMSARTAKAEGKELTPKRLIAIAKYSIKTSNVGSEILMHPTGQGRDMTPTQAAAYSATAPPMLPAAPQRNPLILAKRNEAAPEPVATVPPAKPPPAPAAKKKKKEDEEEGTWWDHNKSWMIPVALVAVGVIALYFIVKKKQAKAAKAAQELSDQAALDEQEMN